MKEEERNIEALLRKISLLETHVEELTQSESVLREALSQSKAEIAGDALLKELRVSEARYRFLVENASDIVWTFDLNSMTYDFISPSVERLLGFSSREARGRTIGDSHPPEIRQHVIDAFTELMRGDHTDDHMVIEAEHFHRDGSRVWMEISAAPIRDDKGAVVGFSGVSRDISDRKRAEFDQQQAIAALQSSEKNFRLSLDESPLGVRIVSQTGETRYVNRVLQGLFGYESIEDWRETTVADRYTAESYLEHLARKEKRARGEEVPSEYEIEIVKKSGEVGHLQVWRKEIIWSGEPCFQLIYEDITLQRHALKLLEASEERYRSILDDIKEGYFETDLKGNYTFINDALARMHKCRPEEMYGMNYREYMTEEVAEQVFAIYNSVYRTGIPALMANYSVITKDGTVQWRDMSVSLIRDATGAPSGFRGVVRDVTEQKEAERRLQEAEYRYRTLADSGRALIWTSGRDKKRDYLNRTWREFTGHTLDEDLGDGWMSSVHPEDLDRLLMVYENAFDRRESFNITYRLRRYDGEYRWLLSEGTPRYDSKGNFLGYIAHCLDVTSQQAMEASIVKIRKSLDEAQKVAKIGSWEWERATDEVYCSREFLRIVGAEDETFQGTFRDFIELFDAAGRSDVSKVIQSVLDEVTQRSVEFSFIGRDGTPVEVYHEIVPMEDEKGHITSVIGILQDITERKRVDRELENARNQLLQSEKLTSLGRISAGVAHEILNPVGIISLELQILKTMEALSPEVIEELDICMEQVNRVVAITENLREFSRISKKEVQADNINEVVQDVVKLCSPQMRLDGITCHLACQPNLPSIELDRKKIEQVLINLFSNAFDAMEGRGRKELFVRTESRYAGSGHCLRITIADTGAGIKKKDLRLIFDPFYSTKEQGKGTGLGLSITYGIVKDHDGSIWAENNEWGGASFIIEFPVDSAGRTGSRES